MFKKADMHLSSTFLFWLSIQHQHFIVIYKQNNSLLVEMFCVEHHIFLTQVLTLASRKYEISMNRHWGNPIFC